jgi:SOS-response transcriptional repressor LexA
MFIYYREILMIEGIKERFAIIRKENGLNVKEFAASLDMEPTTVSSIESGKREPSKEVLLNLAIKYAVSLNWIFTGIGEKRLTKAIQEEKHPLIANLEIFIKANMGGIESRLSALEKRLKAAPDLEYPAETGDEGSYTAEHEPEYRIQTGNVVFCDDIAAGPPIWQSEDKGRVVDVPHHLIKTRESDYYALRVKGNSMIDAFIPDGSMALIKKSDVPQHGKIQVIWLDGRVTLKRMQEEEDHSWTLCYEDGTERTIPLGEQNLIQGDFVAVLPPATRPRTRV